MTADWPAMREDALLTVRRRLITGERHQWVLTRGPGSTTVVVHFWLDRASTWRQTREDAGGGDIAAVLLRFPQLRSLAKGAITEYRVDEEVADPAVFVSLLTVDRSGGPEGADRWPGDSGEEWVESDATLSDWGETFRWFPRWARVNDARVSAIEIDLPDGAITQPVLTDESMEELVPIQEIARESWHSESGGAPISWDGGHTLSLLAPGLASSLPREDSWETEEPTHLFLRLPEDPADLGRFLAGWVIEKEADVAAALELEPLDPDGELRGTDRDLWERRLGGELTVSFDVDVTEPTRQALRDALARRSERYRQTRAGLMNPNSATGQLLATALDAAHEGDTSRLTSGEWDDA